MSGLTFIVSAGSKDTQKRDPPGSPVVKTLSSHAGGAGSIPDGGAKIPHAFWPKNENIKQNQYRNKFTMKKLLLSFKKKKDTRKGNQNSSQLNKSPIPITRVGTVTISLSLNN